MAMEGMWAHYTLHSTSNLVARHAMLRNLQSMRLQQEQRLVRVDNGEKELDRQGADVMLKVSLYACVCHACVCHAKHRLANDSSLFSQILAAESKERQLLEASLRSKGGRD